MNKQAYSSYAEWYKVGPFSTYVRAAGIAGNTISVVEATQPAGDLSDPPINDLVLIRMLSSDVGCTIDLGAGRFSARQRYGDFILVSPNTRSDIQMYTPHSVELFSLPARQCRELLSEESTHSLDFGKLHSGVFRSDLLNALCQRLVEAVRTPHAACRLFADSASMSLLGELTLLAGVDRTIRQRHDVRDWRIRQSMELIDAHLDDDIPLGALAAAANLSPSHYIALFRAATGVSPHAWMMRRKIERSCKMLSRRETTITEVAMTLGFSSSQHFATSFRAHMGMTPTVWRRERLA